MNRLAQLKRQRLELDAEIADLHQRQLQDAISAVRQTLSEQAADLSEVDERQLLREVARAMNLQVRSDLEKPGALSEAATRSLLAEISPAEL